MEIVPVIESTESGLVVSSETIAEGAGVEHRAVLQLIEKRREDLEQFGTLAFEMRKSGGMPTRIALLNEQQSTLLMTFQRNTERVVKFKVALVRAFFEMAKQLQAPQPTGERLLALAVVEAQAMLEAKSQQIAELTPKAEAYDSFMDADGTYSIGAVAKMLGRSQNKLFNDLRSNGILISTGHMRNVPYQKYMNHFAVKAYAFTRSGGNESTSYTTRVLPSGIDFLRKKLEVAAA